jgi:hypothetical protein
MRQQRRVVKGGGASNSCLAGVMLHACGGHVMIAHAVCCCCCWLLCPPPAQHTSSSFILCLKSKGSLTCRMGELGLRCSSRPGGSSRSSWPGGVAGGPCPCPCPCPFLHSHNSHHRAHVTIQGVVFRLFFMMTFFYDSAAVLLPTTWGAHLGSWPGAVANQLRVGPVPAHFWTGKTQMAAHIEQV